MTTKFFSIFSGVVLMAGVVGVANAAPVNLSSTQMDTVTAGGSVSATATASAYGSSTASATQTGTVAAANSAIGTTFQAGYGGAWATGTTGANANTSVTTGGVTFENQIGGTSSSSFGTLSYSFTVAYK
ncbi:hypothetical protein [Crenothrix sp.]|uniref:hypothetical protein n=1 Tax=Crenothrix sp. TaxID=3100433 RepID=UPI00374C9688